MTGTGLYRSAAILLASAVFIAPAHAGFFDQFFGGFGGAPQPSPFSYPAPGVFQNRPYIHHRRYPKREAIDEKPVRQTTTDVMHDPTLRAGDAVVMDGGIVVFTGPERHAHREKDFVAFEQAPINSREKTELAALSVKPSPPSAGDHLMSGRSSVSLVKGILIKDQHGKLIRYVGP